MASLQGRTLVVVGGSSGIGLRVAELAAQQGARLIIVGRDEARLLAARQTLQAQGAEVDAHRADAHDATSLQALFAALPDFDHLVSMVGDVSGGGFLAQPVEEIRRVLDSKFFANVRIAQAAAPKLRAGGSLVFTSGTGGRAQDACGPYVGNLAINAMVEGLAVELAPKARVNAVSPTWTVTPFWRGLAPEQVEATRAHFAARIPLSRTASIDELAAAYLFLMSNDFITGQHLAVDGGVMLGA
jgi:NAD(P)-dependent dehydrogenase (short-subunit alcohol dehydrogenase family)